MSEIRNILLVTLDCARADVTYGGAYGAIERLRARGVACTSAISSAPLTPVSHATVFTGLQPHAHGLRHLLRDPLASGTPTLAGHLSRLGFATGAVLGAPALNRWYGLIDGFGSYDDKIRRAAGLPVRDAADVASLGVRWLSKRRRAERWMCFLHFFDAHWPYARGEGAANPYERALAYADQHLGAVLDALADAKQLDSTLVVVFGDHGEDLGGAYPNDKAGEALGHPEERGHGCLLYQQTQHVPLIFAHPSLPRGECARAVGLVDVSPTICALLGVEPMGQTHGIDVSPQLLGRDGAASRTLYAETLMPGELAESGRFPHLQSLQAMWLGGGVKVVRAGGDDATARVFRLAGDPLERDPLPLSAIPDRTALRWPCGV